MLGFLYGYSQFLEYGVYALLYYVAAGYQEEFKEDHENDLIAIRDFSQKLFIAIFAMMYGAMSAGSCQQYGPDFGKAKTAALNIFGIVDVPSEINAIEQPNRDRLRKIDFAKFRGEVEFEDVWFRYPTRSDWILKGLNLKINQNETVALVGESGCGKSTIVSLLLRFYDVNEGRILIDGFDVREYDLIDLRKAMGLVM